MYGVRVQQGESSFPSREGQEDRSHQHNGSPFPMRKGQGDRSHRAGRILVARNLQLRNHSGTELFAALPIAYGEHLVRSLRAPGIRPVEEMFTLAGSLSPLAGAGLPFEDIFERAAIGMALVGLDG